MKVVLLEDVGNGKIIHCEKLEPATLNPGKMIVDEEYTIDIGNILKIVNAERVDSVVPLYSERGKHFVCDNCSLVLEEGRDDFCPQCGVKVNWSEYYMNEENDKNESAD